MQVVNTASQWVLEWSWPPMTHSDAMAVQAWLNSLRGMVGTFYFKPKQDKSNNLTGRTLNQPGYGYNEAVQVAGWAANAPSQLKPGQYFQIADQLHQIINVSANATAAGLVEIEFEPSLRSTRPAGTIVNFATPAGLFRLGSADGIAYTLDPNGLPQFGNISAREVIE